MSGVHLSAVHGFAVPLRRAGAALRVAGTTLALALMLAVPGAAPAEEAAEPAELAAADDHSNVPVPAAATQVTRTSGSILRELKAVVAAEPAAVLSFYRRELTRRGWKEDKAGAVDDSVEIRRGFSGAEGTAVLVLGRAAGPTTISLVIRASEEVVAARALEQREAERASRGESIADPEFVKTDDPEAAKRGERPRPHAAAYPIPLPQSAESVTFDGEGGRLAFTSGASVRELEMFYRLALKPLGFTERPRDGHVAVAELAFVKGGEPVTITFAREGSRVVVTATGGALKAAAR
ncbi:MAG: hypothetical protein P4M07_08765 [Xanthobacteraceae bacterium]|nr:hypothetical protein [Xanthobacteraceae bacterium]